MYANKKQVKPCNPKALLRCLLFSFMLLFVGAGLTLPIKARANIVVDEVRPLNLGTLAIPTNSTPTSLVLQLNEQLIAAAGIVVVSPAYTGLYEVTGLPASVRATVTVTNTALTLMGSGAGEKLHLSSFATPPLFTNPNGQLTFPLAVTATSSGNGNGYLDGDYQANATMTIRYWSPSDNQYREHYFYFNPFATLQTGVNLVEESALHFGTLFARAEANEQAKLILKPNGNTEIINAGEAQLVSISPAQPARLKVTGAAKHYRISIVLPNAPVLLKHQSYTGAPRFIISDFHSVPALSGVTNHEGEVEFNVGATLSTELTPTTLVYPTGRYQGTFEVIVSY